MSKESDFVDLLHREMQELQIWCQGKEEVQAKLEELQGEKKC